MTDQSDIESGGSEPGCNLTGRGVLERIGLKNLPVAGLDPALDPGQTDRPEVRFHPGPGVHVGFRGLGWWKPFLDDHGDAGIQVMSLPGAMNLEDPMVGGLGEPGAKADGAPVKHLAL